MAALEASPPTLDAAASFHFYAPIGSIHTQTDLSQWPAANGAAAVAAATRMEAKAREAEHALVAEVDARFATLTSAVERADAIVLPETTNMTVRPATYCRWISLASGWPVAPLGERLWAHCIERRDIFIGIVVDKMADLASVPRLPDTNAPWDPATWNPGALHLSTLILPGETKAPMDYGTLEGQFQARLGRRFEKAREDLGAQLRYSLAARAASGVVLPPAEDCWALLGPYATALGQVPAAAGVAGDLGRTCMAAMPAQIAAAVQRVGDGIMAGLKAEAARVREAAVGNTRIDRTAQDTCDGLLSPHFPAARTRYADPASFPSAPRLGVLGRACLGAATDIRQVVLDKHLAAAIAGLPGPDAVEAWAAAAWFAAPPGGTGWIDHQRDPAALQWFTAAYETAVAPLRKAATVRAADAIASATSPAGQTPAEDVCAARQRNPADTALGKRWSRMNPDPAAEARSLEALRAKPALSASEAEALVTLTCRTLHDRMVAARVADAMADSGVDRTFAEGERLAVPRHEDGRLLEVDALMLIRGAAADGIRVTFERGGWGSSPSMAIAPSGAKSPRLDGTLRHETMDDGTKVLVIRKLALLPGLRTPEETIACLLTPSDQADGEARLYMFGAVGGAVLSNIPELHSGDVRDAFARADAAKTCRAAKAGFTSRAGMAVR